MGKMTKPSIWTKKELELLTEAYPKLGRCSELQKLFPTRTMEGICLKANRIGLRRINNPRIKRTELEYLELLKSTNFTSLEEYKGSTTPIKHRCNLCTHEWLTRPQHILRKGAQCPVCDLKSRKSTISYVDTVLSTSGYTRLSEYINSYSPISIKHNTCGYIWTTVFRYIQQGSGCPICNRGYGQVYSNGNMPDKATIYLLKIQVNKELFYKVGVTTGTVQRRVNEIKSSIGQDSTMIEILGEASSGGLAILLREKKLLNKYIKYNTKVTFGGRTEVLSIDNPLEDILEDLKND